jgi:hypothetical protein
MRCLYLRMVLGEGWTEMVVVEITGAMIRAEGQSPRGGVMEEYWRVDEGARMIGVKSSGLMICRG